MQQPPPGPDLAPDETLDHLVGDVWVHQLRGGHRFSTDDVVCGWWAAQAHPAARTILDLGSGVGSVGLVAWSLLARGVPEVSLVGVEAQEVSHRLACKTVDRSGLQGQVRMLRGDLRDLDAAIGPGTFDLITGSPPYFPEGSALASPNPQRAACRMELRGSVLDYARAAAPRLAPGGRYVYVMLARDPRTHEAPSWAGLQVLHRWQVVFRRGVDPMLSVVTCGRAEDGPFPPVREETMVIREASGEVGEDYERVKRALGFGQAGG